jgi:hypothetical protein
MGRLFIGCSRFSDNIIFDSSRGDEYAKDDLKETQKKE